MGDRRCCCGKMVLLWDYDHYPIALGIAKNVYATNGVTAHLRSEWTGNLNDYVLIIWPMAIRDPEWWGSITSGSWSGRFVITAEYGSPYDPYPTTRIYVNSKVALHGITVANDICDPPWWPPAEQGTIEVHQLMDGVTSFQFAATASVSGGNTLSRTTFEGVYKPFLQQKRNGPIDWVVSGDSNVVEDSTITIPWNNTRFLLNLFNKPLP